MKGLSVMDKKVIESKANEVLSAIPEATKTFVDVLEIAKKNGFIVGNAKLPIDEDGFILVNNQRKIEGLNTNKVIGVNANLDFAMKRFILAHELGHYFLKAKEENIYAHREHYTGRNEEENDIDFFAACLLMPSHLFIEKVKDLKGQNIYDDLLIEELAAYFNSPIESVKRRIKELNLDTTVGD